MLKCLRIPFYIFRRLTHKKYFGTGNWYQNDTIWRSILDINRIMIYADKNGMLQEKPQRRFFTLGDMIVAGESNGPLAPTAKKCGVLLCAENPVAFDRTVIHLMGFRYEMLPVLNRIDTIDQYKIPNISAEEISIRSNRKNMDHKILANITEAYCGYFTPAEGWQIISNQSQV